MNYNDAQNELMEYLQQEHNRQDTNIELIASENFPSYNVRMAQATCLTSKYAEGYPAKTGAFTSAGNKGRYYGGCEYIDKIEDLCRREWQKAFRTDYHVNVQPHSGTQANMAAYAAILKPGDTILSLRLDCYAHLSHGAPVNFSGKLYNVVNYGLNGYDKIDYNNLYETIRACRPNVVVAGTSAYPREIDFVKIKEVINKAVMDAKITEHPVYYMVDMAHVAGLIAAGEHCSPFGYADIITTTSQKTARGPRGGIIFCLPELAKKIDSAVMPGNQGGPLEHVIAAKAFAAIEMQKPEFGAYIKAVKGNCKAMANVFNTFGIKMITGGTDNHLILLDLRDTGVTGKQLQDFLDEYGITGNKNCVPNDPLSAKDTSGYRIGTAAMTTRGMTLNQFKSTATLIVCAIQVLQSQVNNRDDSVAMACFTHNLLKLKMSLAKNLIPVDRIGRTKELEEFWHWEI